MPPCCVLHLFGLALRGFWVWVKCLHTAFSRRPIRKLSLSGNLYRTYSKCVSSQKTIRNCIFLKKPIRNRISQGTYPRSLPHKKTYPKRQEPIGSQGFDIKQLEVLLETWAAHLQAHHRRGDAGRGQLPACDGLCVSRPDVGTPARHECS